MSADFKVTGIRIHNPPYRVDGVWMLASVTMESGVFTVAGIGLVQNDAGQRLVYLPKFERRARVILNSGVGFPALLEAVLIPTGPDVDLWDSQVAADVSPYAP